MLKSNVEKKKKSCGYFSALDIQEKAEKGRK